MRPATSLLLAALAAGGLGLAAGLWHASRPQALSTPPAPLPAGVVPAGPGDALPRLVLEDLQGNSVELGGIAPDRPLLVNVWASWCGPCIEEMPELQRFADSQGDDGIQVVGLALDTPEAVAGFLQQIAVDYPVLLDQPGPADASVWLGNTRGLLPYTVLVDARRRVVRQKLGPFKPGEIEEWATHRP